MINKIHPCLWFNSQAQAAAEFYCFVFKNSNITVNTPMVVNFELNGQKFMALNGGPAHAPNPSISFYVVCETLDEVKQAWAELTQNGQILMPLDHYPWSDLYGFVQDKFGISWQLALGRIEEVGQKFTPSLMFTNQQVGKAEQAINFYTSIFHNSSVVGISKYDEQENDVTGYVKHAQFKLNNQVFMAMDSSMSHAFTFSEGISLVVECQTQDEIDYYWSKLTEGGREDRCGWLKDQFGLSWQIVPVVLGKLMTDPQKAPQIMQAFMQMKKFNIEELMNA